MFAYIENVNNEINALKKQNLTVVIKFSKPFDGERLGILYALLQCFLRNKRMAEKTKSYVEL